MMTNERQYKNRIMAQMRRSGRWAMVDNLIADCSKEKCLDCLFLGDDCDINKAKWLKAKYVPQKVKSQLEKILEALPNLNWIAKDKNGTVCGYTDKPYKNKDTGEWFGNTYVNLTAFAKLKIEAVKWEDTEPTSREEVLK